MRAWVRLAGVILAGVILAGTAVVAAQAALAVGSEAEEELSAGSPACALALPYLAVDGLIVVTVAIEGTPGFNMVLDTGTNVSALYDPQLADALGLVLNAEALARGYGAGTLEVRLSSAARISVGGQDLMTSPLAVHAAMALPRLGDGTEVHGLLGWELFDRWVVEIDPDAQVLVLYPPEIWHGTLETWVAAEARVLELQVVDHRPVLQARITTQKGRRTRARLLLDTGSAGLVTLIAGSRRALRIPKDARRVQVLGIAGPALVHLARLGLLEVGDVRVPAPEARFIPAYQLPASLNIPKLDGVLGNRFLEQHHVWIDLPRSRIYLVPREEIALPSPLH